MIMGNLTDQVFHGSRLATCFVDLDGTILQVNRAFELLTGLSARELISRPCYEIIPDESCSSQACPLRRLREGEPAATWRRSLQREDGCHVACRAHAIPIRDESNEVVGAFECLEVLDTDESESKAAGEIESAAARMQRLTALLACLRDEEAALGEKLHWIAAALVAAHPGSYCQVWLRGLDLPAVLPAAVLPPGVLQPGVLPPGVLPPGVREEIPRMSGVDSFEDPTSHCPVYLAAAAGAEPEEDHHPWMVPIPRVDRPEDDPAANLGELRIHSPHDPGEEFAQEAELLAQIAAQQLACAQRVQALLSKVRLQECILAALPYPVYWKNLRQEYAGCNPAMLNVCGLSSPEQIIGRKGEELGLTLEGQTPLAACDELVIASGEHAMNVEQKVPLSDGTEAVYLTSKSPLRDGSGRIAGIVGSAVDVTTQKQANEALARVQAALDDATDAVLIANREGRTGYLNMAFGHLLEHTLDSINAEGLEVIFTSTDALRRLHKDLGGLEKWEAELELRTRGGRVFPAHVRAAPLISDELESRGMLLIITDLTSSRALQQQLMQAQKMESVGQLAAGIAHEINTPSQYVSDNVHFLQDAMNDIRALVTALRVLAKERPGPERPGPERPGPARPGPERPGPARPGPEPTADRPDSIEQVAAIQARIESLLEEADIEFLEAEIPLALEQAREGLERIGTIVRAMKEFSHPGTKEKQIISINEAIQSTITVTTHHWKYVAQLTTDLDPNLPQIPCHPGEFNQAILNLIVNAADAIAERRAETPDAMGRIQISTRSDGPWVEIRVADDGGGIPAEIQERIFEPFFTTKDVGKGSGQGLAITYAAIVDKHAGSLAFETQPGQGTTFVIRLPVDSNGGKAAAA
jgi:PAS domain S-box-containing protein